MELEFFGANCMRISGRGYSIVVDDNLSTLGKKSITKESDICLKTFSGIPTPKETHFLADTPGEYEISGVTINGIAARSHMDEEGKHTATIFTIESDDAKVVILGHIYPDLSEQQVEAIGAVDMAIIPVGGHGFTLDGKGALGITKKVEPQIIIPTHYADKTVKYEVPQATLDEALGEMAMNPSETLPRLKFKKADIADVTRLIVLEVQA